MAIAGRVARIGISGNAVAFVREAASYIRQNLFTYSDPTAVNGVTFPTNSNVTAISSAFIPTAGGGYFNGGINLGDNSMERTAYKSVSTLSVGARYIMSAYVLMGDSSAPDPGSAGAGKDFAFFFNGGDETNASAYTVTLIGSSVYRVSAPILYTTGTTFGVHKQVGHSTKTCKITGFQLEKVPSVSSTVGTYTATQATAEYGKYRLSTSSQRVWDATATVTVLEEAAGAKSSDPATAVGSAGGAVAIHPNGNWIAVGFASAPYVHVYAYDSTTGAIGAKSSDPGTALPAGIGVGGMAWSPDGAYLAFAVAASPYIQIYAFNATTGAIGSKLANPASLPTGAAQSVAWNADGTAVAVGLVVSPYIEAYAFAAGAIGAKASNPATLPTGTVYGLSWRVGSTHVALAHENSPFVTVYAWSGGAFGAKVSDPATLPTGFAFALDWSPAGDYLAVGHGASPFLSVYPWSSGFGAKLSDPATVPGDTQFGVKFSPSGNHLACCGAASGKLSIYPFAGALAPKLDAPATVPTGVCYSVGWAPNGKWLGVGMDSSPYLHVYQFSKASTESWTPNRLDGWVQAQAANYARQGIEISSSVRAPAYVLGAKEWSLSVEDELYDASTFETCGTNGGWRVMEESGLKNVSGTLAQFWGLTDDDAMQALISGTAATIVEIVSDRDASEVFARVACFFNKDQLSAALGGAVEEAVEFTGSADADGRALALPVYAL